MNYAEAINQTIQDAIETSRNFGRLLAQAGFDLKDTVFPTEVDPRFAREGYEEQLRDYPNG